MTRSVRPAPRGTNPSRLRTMAVPTVASGSTSRASSLPLW